MLEWLSGSSNCLLFKKIKINYRLGWLSWSICLVCMCRCWLWWRGWKNFGILVRALVDWWTLCGSVCQILFSYFPFSTILELVGFIWKKSGSLDQLLSSWPDGSCLRWTGVWGSFVSVTTTWACLGCRVNPPRRHTGSCGPSSNYLGRHPPFFNAPK